MQDRLPMVAASMYVTDAVEAILIRAANFVKSAFMFAVGVPREEYLESSPSVMSVTLGVMFRESLDMIPVDTEGIVRYSRWMTNPEHDEYEDDGDAIQQTVRVLRVEADTPEEAEAIAEQQITQCLQAEGYDNVILTFVGVEPLDGPGAA